MNIAPGVVTWAAINSVPAPTRWQSMYSHLALNHLSATMPSSVGMKTAAIPSELYTAPIDAPSNLSVTNI